MTPRFFLPGIRETGQVVLLGGEEYHHLRKVLRLEAGDTIALFDGQGRGFAGRIAGLSRGEARIVLGAEEPRERESDLRLTLVAALSKGEKFELVVQKATELGVSEIRPVYSERADVRPAPGRGEKKMDRWRRVALEACKQSGRTRIPLVHEPRNVEEALALLAADMRIVLDPEGPAGTAETIRKAAAAGAVAVAVGPEGGWSAGEMKGFREAGFLSLRLGPRILRTETAAIVSTALLQFLAGDLGAGRGTEGPSPRR
jgi:16S rRNA (uracil1498-N3)-methyltransferase